MKLLRPDGHRDPDSDAGYLAGFTTDIGRTHHVNQDAGGTWTWISSDGTPRGLAVVADGVSAGARSEEASRLAVRMVSEEVAPLVSGEAPSLQAVRRALEVAVRDANERISERPHDLPDRADATTLVAVACVEGEGVGVWCGDSRAYLIGSQAARLLTRDHSWTEEIVARGAMTREEAEEDPRAHMITRWLGPPRRDDPGIEAFRFRLAPGQSVLLCTDGLYGYFKGEAGESELADVIRSHAGAPQRAADALVSMALRRGGHDNVTAAILMRSS